jgi:hypothetical protein
VAIVTIAQRDPTEGASNFFLQEFGCGFFQVPYSLASGAAEARLFGGSISCRVP